MRGEGVTRNTRRLESARRAKTPKDLWLDCRRRRFGPHGEGPVAPEQIGCLPDERSLPDSATVLGHLSISDGGGTPVRQSAPSRSK